MKHDLQRICTHCAVEVFRGPACKPKLAVLDDPLESLLHSHSSTWPGQPHDEVHEQSLDSPRVDNAAVNEEVSWFHSGSSQTKAQNPLDLQMLAGKLQTLKEMQEMQDSAEQELPTAENEEELRLAALKGAEQRLEYHPASGEATEAVIRQYLKQWDANFVPAHQQQMVVSPKQRLVSTQHKVEDTTATRNNETSQGREACQQLQILLEEARAAEAEANTQAAEAERTLALEKERRQKTNDARTTLDNDYEHRERKARQLLLAQIMEERQQKQELEIALEAARAEKAMALEQANKAEIEGVQGREALATALAAAQAGQATAWTRADEAWEAKVAAEKSLQAATEVIQGLLPQVSRPHQ